MIKESPLQGIPKPKKEKTKAEFYESYEVTTIMHALNNEPTQWRIMILTAIIGGLRRGELVALQWSNIDFSNNIIHVQRSISLERNGVVYEKGTKNDNECYVDMPIWFMEELQQFRSEWLRLKNHAGIKWKDEKNEYIFHAGYGEPFYYSYPSSWWKKFTNHHHIPYISLHKLRHTSVTLLIEKGAPLKSIQERVGHKQAQTTINTYAHVTKKLSREVANMFDELAPNT